MTKGKIDNDYDDDDDDWSCEEDDVIDDNPIIKLNLDINSDNSFNEEQDVRQRASNMLVNKVQ